MTVSFSSNASPSGPFVAGNHKLAIGTLTFDSSYATNGEAVTAAMFGLNTIEHIRIDRASTSGYVVKWNGSASAPKLVVYYDGVQVATKTVAVSSMTDNGDTTGYIDFASGALPAGTIPVFSKFACSVAFSGDTSAVWKMGIAGDLDRFSADTTQSCFTAITTLSLPKAATALNGTDAARTPRLTVTTGTDFTTVKTAATAAGVASIGYLYPAGTEVASTTDLSAITVSVQVFGR